MSTSTSKATFPCLVWAKGSLTGPRETSESNGRGAAERDTPYPPGPVPCSCMHLQLPPSPVAACR